MDRILIICPEHSKVEVYAKNEDIVWDTMYDGGIFSETKNRCLMNVSDSLKNVYFNF